MVSKQRITRTSKWYNHIEQNDIERITSSLHDNPDRWYQTEQMDTTKFIPERIYCCSHETHIVSHRHLGWPENPYRPHSRLQLHVYSCFPKIDTYLGTYLRMPRSCETWNFYWRSYKSDNEWISVDIQPIMQAWQNFMDEMNIQA